MNASSTQNRKLLLRRQRSQNLIEALEPRQMLTADLTGSFTALPIDAINGSKAKVALQIQNLGDTRAKGKVEVQFFAVADGDSFNPATSTLLTTIKPSLALKAGASITKTVQLPISASTPAGNYHIFAVIDPRNRVAESNESNNTVESGVLGIAQRQVDLSTSIAVRSTPKLVAGAANRATARVTVTNLGTAAAAPGQVVDLSVVARPVGVADTSQDVLLTSANARINVSNLPAGASRTVSVPITFPSTLQQGSFTLMSDTNFAANSPAVGVGTSATPVMLETNTLNNTGILATPVVVSAAVAPLPEEPAPSLPVVINNPGSLGSSSTFGTPITSTSDGLIPTSGSFNVTPTSDFNPTIGSQAVIPSTGGFSLANAGFTTPTLITVAPTAIGAGFTPTAGLIGTSSPFIVTVPSGSTATTFSSSFGSSPTLVTI